MSTITTGYTKDLTVPCTSIDLFMRERQSNAWSEVNMGRGLTDSRTHGVVWADFESEIVLFNVSTNVMVHLDDVGRHHWHGFADGQPMDESLYSALVERKLLSVSGE